VKLLLEIQTSDAALHIFGYTVSLCHGLRIANGLPSAHYEPRALLSTLIIKYLASLLTYTGVVIHTYMILNSSLKLCRAGGQFFERGQFSLCQRFYLHNLPPFGEL